MRLTIDLAGDTQINRQLLRMTDQFSNLTPAFDKIASDLADIERQQFLTEGSASGHPWPQLSPGYRAWKDVHFPGARILVRTGKLRDSVTERPFGMERITPYSMELGVARNIRYAKFHQEGTPRMPQRKVMDLTERQRVEMVKTLQRFCMSGRV